MSTKIREPMSREARGLLGAQARWGELPRVVRLDSLTTAERAVVLALIEAKMSAPAATADAPQEDGNATASRHRPA